MRHFAANFWCRQRKKEVADKLKELCNKCTEHEFKETMAELQKMLNRAGKAWLDQQMENKAKWALAYDEGQGLVGAAEAVVCASWSHAPRTQLERAIRAVHPSCRLS